MTAVYSLTQGTTPLLISIPHDGRELMPGQATRMTDIGKALPDTDWFVRDLYSFASDIGAYVIAANFSRYVIDLNRPADDVALYAEQISTGLCPIQTFSGDSIYLSGEVVSAAEQDDRTRRYWRPYHDKIEKTLNTLKHEFGYALLWDAHSIASEVPRLFHGVLPDLNVGTNGGDSCAPPYAAAVMAVAESLDYSAVLNGRFRGGYITRNYGDPDNNVNAIQLELSQRCYMIENKPSYDAALAGKIGEVLRRMLLAFVTTDRGLGRGSLE